MTPASDPGRGGSSAPGGAAGAPPILLLGASGRLGSAIAAALSDAGLALATPSRDELRFEPHAPDEAAARWLDRWPARVVVDAIAMSDVDRCELEPEAAHVLNAVLPAALARGAAQRAARLIHFSTDFVFDGVLGEARGPGGRRPYRESDAARPLSVYGRSKLAGERAIAAAGCDHWVFRVSWLYGSPRGNLAARLLEPGESGQPIRLADDRFGVPNPVQLLAAELAFCCRTALGAVAQGDGSGHGDGHGAPYARAQGHEQAGAPLPASGVYHLSCHGATTWHAFAREFLRQAIAAGRIDARQAPSIEPFDEASLRRPARRPAWSPLDPGLYERRFGRRLPHWQEAIASALA